MDESTLRSKLTSEIAEVPWGPLAPHNGRGHLWLADGLELVDIGMAVATDQTDTVSAWIESGQLRRPTDTEVSAWEAEPTAPLFDFLIVQPFVLAIERPALPN